MESPFAVIMAGGSGTRFWPASRKTLPKQLLALGPKAQQPLIAETVRRAQLVTDPERILVVTNEALVEQTRWTLPHLPTSAFLGEPVARNTAACIGWATSVIAAREPEAMMMVLPSDHYIGDEQAYVAAVDAAVTAAAQGTVTTIGVRPSRPETGYGYIETGAEVESGVLQAQRFVEKPDLETARSYVESGNYVWNSGMFFFRARVMQEALEQYAPELAEGLCEVARLHHRGDGAGALAHAFKRLPSISIDFAVMEKLPSMYVVPADFGWSDLGSWQSTWELAEKDANHNSGEESSIFIDARGNLVRDTAGSEKVVALVGVDNLCVIRTEDALLVIPRERAQDVRSVVAELEAQAKWDKL